MDSFNNAASSFRPRPVPVRTLNEPQAYSVRESAASTTAPSPHPARSDATAVRESYKKKIRLQRRALEWTESLLEECISRINFKLACAHLQRSTYLHILHERHLSSLCSYPLCSNPPRKPYRAYPLSRSKIITSLTGGKIVVEVDGNDQDGFCGETCRRRAEWVSRVEGAFGDGLFEDEDEDSGRVGRWKLLEEIEEIEQIEEGKEEVKEAVVPEVPPPSPAKQSNSPSDQILPSSFSLPAPSSPPPPPPPSDLLSSLRIVEHPTPTLPPAAPQPDLPPSPSASQPLRPSKLKPSPTPQGASPSTPTARTTKEIREHERLRRVDASNASLVPVDILGFADSLITVPPPPSSSSSTVRPAGGPSNARSQTEEQEGGDQGGQDEEEEVMTEEGAAWELMEAARLAMQGP